MELIKGKKYRVTDQQGNCFVMRAITEHTLEMVPSFLVGLVGDDLERFRIQPKTMGFVDLQIEALEAEPAPQASAQPSMDQARYAALMEMLQAITAGVYSRSPYGQKDFDPEQAILHIRTRLAAFEKGNA